MKKILIILLFIVMFTYSCKNNDEILGANGSNNNSESSSGGVVIEKIPNTFTASQLYMFDIAVNDITISPDTQEELDMLFKNYIFEKDIYSSENGSSKIDYHFDKDGNITVTSTGVVQKEFIKSCIVQIPNDGTSMSSQYVLAGIYTGGRFSTREEIVVPRKDQEKNFNGTSTYMLQFYTNNRGINMTNVFTPQLISNYFVGPVDSSLYVEKNKNVSTRYKLSNPDAISSQYKNIEVNLNDENTLKKIYLDQLQNKYIAYSDGKKRFDINKSTGDFTKNGEVYKKFIKACIVRVRDTGFPMNGQYTIGGVYQVQKIDGNESEHSDGGREEIIALRYDRSYMLHYGNNNGLRSSLDIYSGKYPPSVSKKYNPDDFFYSPEYRVLESFDYLGKKDYRKDYLVADE